MGKTVKITRAIFPIFCFFLIWQIFSILNLLNPEFLSSPVGLAKKLFDLLLHYNFATDILQSIKRVLIGFAIAGVIGISLGIICGIYKLIYHCLNPIIEILRPIPPVAWVPLTILWLGIGDKPAFFLVFLGAFFPIFTNTYLGISTIDKMYKRAADSLGANKIIYITDVLIPATLPNIFVGLKIGLGISWMVVIIAEMVGAQSGLGYMIQINRMALEIPNVIVGMIVIGFVGFAMHILMSSLEHLLIPWSQKYENPV